MYLKHIVYIPLTSLVTLCGLAANTSKAADAKASQTITITVPPMRILYLDEQNRIVSILSNTPAISDKELQAFKAGAEITVSNEIRAQYEKLLPIVDWSRIGWVYQRANFEVQLPETAQPAKKADDEIEASLCESIRADEAGETIIIYESVFDRASKMNTFPLPPHKDNHIIRATVYDAEGLTEISTEYLPQYQH